MYLEKLIKQLPQEKKKIKIRGLAINSKKIKKGFIFFAIKGEKNNGEKFIEESVKNGAVAIVCSKSCNYKNSKIPIIKTSDTRQLLSEISAKFYKLKPSNIIAVTGTNGKTSVADLFFQILNLNKMPVASIGTLGVKFKNKKIKLNLTSPDTISLHKILTEIKKNKIDNVILEASSHGLHQKRIHHLKLKAGIFTNFSRDHLDYHKSMGSYLKSKLILFKEILPVNGKIISDKNIKEYSILKQISKSKKLKYFDINKIKKKLMMVKKINLNDFQLKNLAMAVSAAKLCKLKESKILNSLNKIKDVNGRLELVKTFSNGVRIFVDFAHTPDALLKSLQALKKTQNKNISLVFGCGGDRDVKKRPLMGKVACKNSKKIYVTDDNPRNEKPEKIRNEIIKNIKNKNCYNIGNRFKAIKTALMNAEPNEIILIAGKGHEVEQIYKNKIISVSDKQLVKKLKLEPKTISDQNQTFFENKKIFKEIIKGVKIKNFHGLAIDSRVVKKNNLFLTIKGKNKDGINFISQAIKKGAKYIISSKKKKDFSNKTLKVKNEIKFLNNFAKKKRNYTSAKIVAITGSAGKTSLKDLINNLFQNFGNTFCSPKSYNNHFGVPLSLSFLNTKHKYGIFEVGMSRAGEINNLTKLIKPHVGIITNIGEAHIENFSNTRGIADAKGEIINNIEKNGTLILNRDDKYYNYLMKKAVLKNLKIVSFGMSKKSDVYPVSILKTTKNSKLTIKSKEKLFSFQIRNLNIYNVLASIALLTECKLDVNKVLKFFNRYEPTEGRGKIYKIKRYKKYFKLIDESYNANPLSVKSAITSFNSIKKQNFKKYLLLGDMLELGKKSDELHKDLSKVINNSDIDKVFIKGVKTLTTYKNIIKKKRGNILQHYEDIDFTLNNFIANNDYLMIKGSNATGLNQFSKRIIKGY